LAGTVEYNDGFFYQQKGGKFVLPSFKFQAHTNDMNFMDLFEVENLGVVATIWTIRIALICMFGTLLLFVLQGSSTAKVSALEEKQASTAMEAAKHLWVLGSFFSLLHAMAAMIFYHSGSHEIAMADTARQTKALLGVSVGIGIYFNYAFVGCWLMDAMWWIARPNSYESRTKIFNWLIYGFLIFIAINGAIVFETGIIRWVSVFGIAVLSLLFVKRHLSKTGD
jgi:hypothetical protein